MDVRFAEGATRRVFARPREVVVVREPAEISAAFARLDAALASGFAIAGYLAYELGAAWNGVPAHPSGGDLLRIGIYDGSSIEAAPVAADAREAMLDASVAGVSEAEYAAALSAIAAGLLEGDVYQVNYTVPFRSRMRGDARALFERVAAVARVPYAALVETEERAFVALSPELFLAIDGDVVRTKPMKGTAAPDDLGELGDDKNRAEHVMIVDLLRNDLHRICRDVRVEAFETIERYPTFSTMTSTIAGRLNGDVGLEALFTATFPCGSVTGAPKRSAMRRIYECERAARGIAMGSIGFLEPRRGGGSRGWWNVAIRTLAIDRTTGAADLRVGGGIVADSTEVGEWREVGLKRRLFRAFELPVGLIETMLVREGVARAEPHLARLRESAWRLGIAVDIASVRGRIRKEALATAGEVLLRLHVAGDGTITVTCRPFDPSPPMAGLALAPSRLDARDPLLRFKTDRRVAYDDALAFARGRGCFEAVLANDRGDLADGARTSIFIEEPDGLLATPRLEDGALDGILRREALASGRASERRIAIAELGSAPSIWIGSAARGFVRARYAS